MLYHLQSSTLNLTVFLSLPSLFPYPEEFTFFLIAVSSLCFGVGFSEVGGFLATARSPVCDVIYCNRVERTLLTRALILDVGLL